MPLPEPSLLRLCEAARRVADHCGVSIEEAKPGLDRAFREHALALFNSRDKRIQDWEYVTIDWEHSSITRRGPSVTYTTESVHVFRQHLDGWIAQAGLAPNRHSATSASRAAAAAHISPAKHVERKARWWSLAGVVGWVRALDGTVTVGQIRSVIVVRCASGRIGARGRRRLYGTDKGLFISPDDPEFVRFSDTWGELQPWSEPISAYEWKDLAFFARPDPAASEQYHLAVAQALDQVWLRTELRSKSKHRLAWADVEFSLSDVIREWPPDEARVSPAESQSSAHAALGLRPAVHPMLRAAIEDALRAQGTPGKTVPWKTFCDHIRSMCQVTANTRGYGDRSIARAVRAINAEPDKHDKSDMSRMS